MKRMSWISLLAFAGVATILTLVVESLALDGLFFFNSGSYNLHLEDRVRFHPIQPGADSVRGQALFGLAEDGVSEDPSQALFEGFSEVFGSVVESNGRTCFTCHRGPNVGFGLPGLPLTNHIAADDTLFTEFEADAQGDPDALFNLEQLGLIKYRVNRFNPTRPQSDPFRQVFAWRKSPKLFNIGLSASFLTDGRGRVMFETTRGAVFSHTQGSDERFDDLFPVQDGNDIEAFLFGLFSDPVLVALREPGDPLHQALSDDPFFTVDVQTPAQRRGQGVFERNCMVCHSTPNVFTNLSNVEPTGNGDRPVTVPSFAPSVGRTFNIGVSERNAHNLRFTQYLGDGQFAPIVLPLAKEDGTLLEYTVTFDIGLAATTGRFEDIGRFKVPQLRKLADNAPYFHDNSAATVEEVVDYFNSADYNHSKDGQRFPIDLRPLERQDLIEFLKIL